jgi:hypothetical protein
MKQRIQSLWQPLYDLAWLRLLLWVAGAGKIGEPRPEVHACLAKIYYQLSDSCEVRGRTTLAQHFRVLARKHDLAGPPPELPPAAAMAQAVPQPPIVTEAFGKPLSREPGKSKDHSNALTRSST